MSDTNGTQTMVRTQVAVNEVGFLLAQGQDVGDLERRIEGALHAGGGFVDFMVVGNRTMSVLITTMSQVVFSVETVLFDPRDNGDHAAPYGSGGLDLF